MALQIVCANPRFTLEFARKCWFCAFNESTNSTGILFAIWGRGPRAFQIGKISVVNHYFGKFSKQTRTAFLVSLKTKLAITHTIAIKLKENRMQF